MGLSRRALMGGGLAGLVAGLLPRSARAAEDLRVVVFWNAGGWDTTYVFDPHFESSVIDGDPEAVAASVGGLDFADSAERPSVRALFEGYAERSVIVNGISVGSISHDACTRRLLTGSRLDREADLAARFAARAGLAEPIPYLVLGGTALPGAHGALVLRDSERTAELLASPSPHEDAVQAYLQGLEVGDGPRRQAWSQSLQRLPTAQASAELLEAEAGPEDNAQVAKALAALDAELCRCVMLEPTMPPLTQLDSHIANHYNQSRALERSFSELLQLVEGLDAAGTLDRTLVVVASEMGRTPVLNGGDGKDHWPYTSALLIGGGVQGGRVLGGTDETLAALGVDRSSGQVDASSSPLGAADFVGGLLQHLGVDPQEELPGCSPLEAL